MIQVFPKFFGRLYVESIGRLEKRIGYKLVFPRISATWIDSWMYVDLTKSWKKFGLDVTGVDYFTMGAVENGLSTRFDRKAKQYQSWVGGYLVKFSHARDWTLQDHFSLAVIDQMNWLRDYGDPHPVCELHPSGFTELGTIEISGRPGKLYCGGGISHSEIGPKRPSLLLRLQMAFVATVYNVVNSGLHLRADNFLPQSAARPYESVYLKGYIAILQIDPDVQAVLYGNAAVYKDDAGQERDTYEMLKDEILDVLKGVEVEKI